MIQSESLWVGATFGAIASSLIICAMTFLVIFSKSPLSTLFITVVVATAVLATGATFGDVRGGFEDGVRHGGVMVQDGMEFIFRQWNQK